MRRWLVMMAGPLIWAAHFLGLYLLSSAADVWGNTDSPAARLAGWAFSLVCLALTAFIGFMLVRRPGPDSVLSWERHVAVTGALVAAIAVVWQTLPLAF